MMERKGWNNLSSALFGHTLKSSVKLLLTVDEAASAHSVLMSFRERLMTTDK